MGPDSVYTRFQLDGRDAAAAWGMKANEALRIPPHWSLYVAVDDANAAARRAAELGGKVVEAPFGVSTLGRMAVLADPTGAVFSIWHGKTLAGTGIAGERGTMVWAGLSSPDPAKASEFYSGLSRWRIAPGENDASGYLQIWNGDQSIGGIPPAGYRDPNAPPHWMPYFGVEDVDASKAVCAASAGKTLMAPTSIENVGRRPALADPQGSVFALFRKSRRS